jgi:Calcium binding
VARKPRRDPKREKRITMEVVVDCYDRHEVAMGWYYYLEGQLRFPFTATCIAQRAVSPLRLKDEVEVIGMPPEEECACEVLVTIRWDRPEGLAVPLAQLKPIRATDAQTKEAVADWHYWRSMGYEY